jgi:hypothetical protein
MSKSRGRAKYRLTVKLDMEWDADVIAWLMKVTRGQRSMMVRDAIRSMLNPKQAADLQTIRAVIAEELARALATQPFPLSSDVSAPKEEVDMEAKWGAKFDKMMGGLADLQDQPGTSE